MSETISRRTFAALTAGLALQPVVASADDTPVILLDGFDELLQASGTSRADYLEQVQDFQRSEAARGIGDVSP